MNRRRFVFIAGGLALLGCGCTAVSGPFPRTARIGILNGASAGDATQQDFVEGLQHGLAELGYTIGQDIWFELRQSYGNDALLTGLAKELVQLPVDVIVSLSSPPTLAARQVTRVTPIVFIGVTDPVGQGIVASIAHPGGNVTGDTSTPPTNYQKLLQMLGLLIPGLSHVAIILDSSNPAGAFKLQATTTAADAMGVQLRVLDLHMVDNVERALAEVLSWQAEALMDFESPGVVSDAAPRLIEFQLQHRIPVAFGPKDRVVAGGLVSFSASFVGLGKTAAGLVDKILRGAKPADLPVQEPTLYELAINQTTAAALGITIPRAVAQEVTDWVQ
jgi:putative ABC transport system substrate-binding protein